MQRGRCQLHRFHDGLFQACDPLPHVLDLVQIILARGLLSDLCVKRGCATQISWMKHKL
ncbi:hypothetical protein ACPOL_3451 [Acidisarcina polymorpha]|uniref:Uncharacterized protein n=1 Tax=Acidisarcina polymorpha TaxID=2211140 RepID=A0A2Z5G0T1_9BACT|nr:hypothetical protein ACPOL_3451 [Acidisarcina polymorpha]